MKSTKSLAFFFALVLSIVTIFATEKSFVLGGSAGWEECTENVRQISKTNGLYGYESLRIATKEHQIDKNTDLYLSFENKDGNITSDETGNYDVVEQNLYFSENAAVGYKACVSRENDVLIALTGNKNSLFGKIGPTGSFSIEFWLKPAVCVSGENVFFWRSSRNNSQYSEYQTIEASFMNGKLEWKFSNVFLDVDKKGTDIYLKSDTTILPEKWSHHYICYDEEEGTIEYYLDGHIESVVYVTDNGTSYGHYLTCVLGNPARIEICKNFTGAIDEFIISHDVKHYLDTNKDFRQTPAFVSVPLKATKKRLPCCFSGKFVVSTRADGVTVFCSQCRFFIHVNG